MISSFLRINFLIFFLMLSFVYGKTTISETKWCPISGLDIKNNINTSIKAKLHNDLERNYSSIYALLEDDINYGVDFDSIKIYDIVSKEYISIKNLHFVFNSSFRGAMHKESFLAFSLENEALKFLNRFGGKVLNSNDMLTLAKKELKNVKIYQRNINHKILYPKGELIFENLCNQNIDMSIYLEINELKADIINNNLCKKMNEENLHALAIYLWGQEYDKTLGSNITLEVKKDDRCPVCAMFVSKYPRWVAQIFYIKHNEEHHFSFDGVKDMMKFYFTPSKWNSMGIKKDDFEKIYVTNYYTSKAIDAKEAFYVEGSTTYGPMGHELIPFKTLEEANSFKIDHNGKRVLKFDEITKEGVYALDGQ